MSVAVKKVPGVETVKVSLTEGMAHIQLAAENKATLEQFRKAVREQGFTPKDARVVVSGDILFNGKSAVFKVSGSGDTLEISSPDALRLGGKKNVTVKGLVGLPKDGAKTRLKIQEVIQGK